MGSSGKVASLSKYILTLPTSKTSVFLAFVVSFLTGAVAACFQPLIVEDSIVYNFLSGGATTFFLFGLTTIAAGALTQPLVNQLHGRHVKLKQSLFLAFFSMVFTCIIYLAGVLISTVVGTNITINSLLLGIVVGFAVGVLVIWSTSNIKFLQAALIATIQPILILSMFVLIVSLTKFSIGLGEYGIITLYLKAIIGAIVLAIAVYSFVSIVESPIRQNLGVGGLELLSLFIGHQTEGSHAMEQSFATMGEPIDTTVGVVSFRNKEGIKANYISPCIHPGPVGSIGGGNMPTVLAQQLNDFSIVAHGAATHDFNPVAQKEIQKITDSINNLLPKLKYTRKASKFERVQSENAKIGAQHFDDGMILLSTFAPIPADDIEYGVGLSMMFAARNATGAKHVAVVDCHNCLDGNVGRLMAGHHRVFEIHDAIAKLKKPEQYPIKMGCAYDPMESLGKEEGIGQSGVKIMITEVDTQKMLYIVFDGNNMAQDSEKNS